MLGKYSIYNMVNEFQANRPLINAYLKGEIVEGASGDDTTIIGLSVGLFLIMMIIIMVIWVWSVWAIVKYWDVMPDWAKVISLISIFLGNGIISLIVTYVSTSGKRGSSKKSKFGFRFY